MRKMVGHARDLLRLAQEFNLEEIDLEVDGIRFRASRTSRALGSSSDVATSVSAVAEPSADGPAGGAEGMREASAPASRGGLTKIASPMIGIFYAASSPDKPPYVAVGDTVEPDTVVCIVEAMKLMNEIKAGVRGKIAECSVGNQTPVKAGQVLFRVDPA